MTVQQIDVDMDAGRVCDAIARIGYSPASAIMDIVDNSVTAGATKILVQIDCDPDKTYASNNNVLRYRVLDNGCGMNDEEMLNALRLGSSVDYPPNSLSKYGMGLKSAGFSLGSRISLLSHKNGAVSSLNYVDRDEISEIGRYIVCRDAAPDELAIELSGFLENDPNGTLVQIEKCSRRNHTSAKKTVDKLQRELGVTYYTFLTREENPLDIVIHCTDKPEVQIRPFDILFLNDAVDGFDKDGYDCKSPCKALEERFTVEEDGTEPVLIKVVLFPRDKMKNHPGFSEEERNQIAAYKVSRTNKGFFVYRNGRLIRWGDNLEGLVGKDDLGFRARIEIATEHDECLNVDVSKQRLSIPEDILKKVDTLVRIPLRQSRDIFTLCEEHFRQDEGIAFNERNQDLAEEDLEEPTGEENVRTQRERRRNLEQETRNRLQEEGETEPDQPVTVEEIPIFQRIRYSDRVTATLLWEPGIHPTDGTFVRINRNHPFYLTVLSKMGEDDSARQALEALIWSCAVGENKATMNLTDIDDEVIEKVLTRFKRIFCWNLESWTTNNQDLFDYD